jgi:hypothetical protein
MNVAEQRAQFIDALNGARSGQIHLASTDSPRLMKRRAQEAAYELGVKVHVEWADDSQTRLSWHQVRRECSSESAV